MSNVNPRTIRIQDKYNPIKVWVFRHYKCGHYTMAQEIQGKQFNKQVRIRRKDLEQALKEV